MKYPSLQEVEDADLYQLASWHRFLGSPGMSAIGSDNFADIIEVELKIQSRIKERFDNHGGMTPQLSKLIGWNP